MGRDSHRRSSSKERERERERDKDRKRDHRDRDRDRDEDRERERRDKERHSSGSKRRRDSDDRDDEEEHRRKRHKSSSSSSSSSSGWDKPAAPSNVSPAVPQVQIPYQVPVQTVVYPHVVPQPFSIPVPAPVPTVPTSTPTTPAAARPKMAELLAKIKATKQELLETQTKSELVVPIKALRIDEFGREIDEDGNVIEIDMQRTKTFMINQKQKKPSQTAASSAATTADPLAYREKDEAEDLRRSKFYDPSIDERLTRPRKDPIRKAFNFVEKGSFLKQAQDMRAKAYEEVKALKNPVSITSTANAPVTLEDIRLELLDITVEDVTPSAEWWDKPLLPEGEYVLDPSSSSSSSTIGKGQEQVKIVFKEQKITHLIEHPIPVTPPGENSTPPQPKVYLTEKERKKLKKMRKAEVQKQKHEDMMVGKIKPDQPKANLTNFVRIYGQEAYMDPTKIEQMVREQMQARLKAHLQRNEENKLTKEEKKEKKLRKLRANNSSSIRCIVFRIKDLSSPLYKRKIEYFVRDAGLTGALLLVQNSVINILIAEGSPRAIRRLKALLLRRIKWNLRGPSAPSTTVASDPSVAADGKAMEDQEAQAEREQPQEEEDDDDDDDEESERMKKVHRDLDSLQSDDTCRIAWEGLVLKRQFPRFRFKRFESDTQCRQYFVKRHIENYWDLARSAFAVLHN